MSKIKLVAWDVYETIIAPHLDDDIIRLRQGSLELLTQIKSKNILQCTCSDGDLTNLKNNLKEAGINWQDYFIDLYKMSYGERKDFSYIVEANKIKFNELLVIGDDYNLDIELAKEQGCKTIWVPEIKEKQSLLDFDEFKTFF
ncbi:MAG: HAD family hydrolase [Candidatus Pacearchaeota archaeon]|jgi:FMN phosphatase YigB (HAD superfamily)